jgi:hypothetical protein
MATKTEPTRAMLAKNFGRDMTREGDEENGVKVEEGTRYPRYSATPHAVPDDVCRKSVAARPLGRFRQQIRRHAEAWVRCCAAFTLQSFL